MTGMPQLLHGLAKERNWVRLNVGHVARARVACIKGMTASRRVKTAKLLRRI